MHPRGVPDSHTGSQIAAVGRAVDHRAADTGIVENRRDIIDHLLDGQRGRRQIGAGVVMARHTDSAVLDHDDIESGLGSPPPHSAIVTD